VRQAGVVRACPSVHYEIFINADPFWHRLRRSARRVRTLPPDVATGTRSKRLFESLRWPFWPSRESPGSRVNSVRYSIATAPAREGREGSQPAMKKTVAVAIAQIAPKLGDV